MTDLPSIRVHGDASPESGDAPPGAIDFAVNVNPLGPDPRVLASVREATLDRYPETTAREARRALAAWLDASADEIVVGNGAADLLWTAARCFAEPQRPTLIVGPTFSELPAAVSQLGRPVLELR